VTVSGLTNDTAYTFTVVATNAYGSSLASAASNSVTPSLNYIEDVFSTWLYTGNGSTQTITNGIDLAGKGGLVWIKNRVDVFRPILTDTVRGVNSQVFSDTDSSAAALTNIITAFNSTGFNLGSFAGSNTNANANVSWTFREQAKFFDVVTWTGTGSNTTIAHSLGAVPACIFVKRIDDFANWQVYHRSLANTQYMVLNSTAAVATGATRWNSTTPTDTVFSLGTDTTVNASGGTYVAYLFAHNAGGFGLTGTDNVISCGSFTTNGSGVATVDLGYEPQWVMVKKTSAGDEANAGFWWMQDNMRGYPVRPGNSQYLQANTSDAETFVSGGGLTFPTSTGFVFNQNYAGFHNSNFIYIAIRRGPMAVPTTGTSVFAPVTRVGTTPNFVSNFPVDLLFYHFRPGGEHQMLPRLTTGRYLKTESTNVEATNTISQFDYMDGVGTGNPTNTNVLGHLFRRAPSFFDVVCYTGNDASTRSINHNLRVVPELIILKRRAPSSAGWPVWASAFTGTGNSLVLNSNEAVASTGLFTTGNPTATTFEIGFDGWTNASGSTYIAYLFASAPGVSKVGSYTGNGSSQTINCGFTTGARFVLIKRINDIGSWLVFDTTRGMVSGTDPFLQLNTAGAETNLDWVYTAASGFEIVTSSGAVNASGGTYIFLAIA
jgi:hypothetical protein